MALKKPPAIALDGKYPPDAGDEPIDSEDEWEEREKKGRAKKAKKKKAPPDESERG